MRQSWFRKPNLYFGGGAVVLFAVAAWYIINRQIDVVVTVGLTLSLILFISGVVIDPGKIREWIGGRQVRYGSNVVITSLAFTGILAVVNFLVYSNPKQWDFTEDKTYTLATETLAVLEEIPDRVDIVGFYTPNSSNSRDSVRPLLDQFLIHSDGKLYYYFLDPLENPFLADQYGVTRDGSLVVVYGERSEVISTANEQQITESLIRLLNPGNRKVYFLTGHGERDFESTEESGFNQVRRTLESKNYETASLNLLVEPKIPEDASVIILAAPQARLEEAEVNVLTEYYEIGGAVVYLSEPGMNPNEEADLLEEYLSSHLGITLRNDFVVDLSSSLPLSGISAQYAVHPITEQIQNLVTYYPSVRSLELQTPETATIEQTELVLTGPNSWGETGIEAFLGQGDLEFNPEADIQGPLVLAAVVEDSISGGRAIVFGDSDFATDGFFFELGNGDMLINAIDWAVGNEQLISLTPKSTTQRFVVPPSDQTIGLIFLVTVILMPGAVILFGVTTWWGRRKRF